MAKARGNKLVPPANFSRNPMAIDARMTTRPPHSQLITDKRSPPSQDYLLAMLGVNPRSGNPSQEWADGERYAPIDPRRNSAREWANGERDFGVQSVSRGMSPFLGNTGTPTSFNPQNQDVLARAAAALNAVQQDRQNPMSSGRMPPLPMSIASQPNRFIGPSAPQSAYNGPNTPAIRNPINREMAPTRDPQAAAMDALRARIDAMTQRSQQANPMAPPAPAYNPMQGEIDRGTRQGNIMMTPSAGSSLEATRNFRDIPTEDLNGITAGTVNSYNGNMDYATNPMRNSAERKIASSQANARRIAGGGAAADPTNIGGRFGGAYGTNLDADATAIAEGRAVRTADGNVVNFTGTPESAREAYMSARQNNYGRTPEQEAARSAEAQRQAAARAARHQQFKDANNGMNYRQYDRMQNQNALTMKAVDEGRLSPAAANFRMQTRADKALRRAGNPMMMGTDASQRLFPDMTAGRGGRAAMPAQNPMLAAFEPGAQNTPEGNALRDQMKVELAQSSPSLTAMGVAPDADPNTFAGSIAAYDGDLTDEGLVEIHNFAKTFRGGQDGTTPFDNAQNMMAAPELLAEMWKLPIGTSPQKLREWYNKYRQETKARLDKAKQNMQTSPAWTVG